VTAVGKVGPGKREIDATGKLVTPGWVDIHTHYDGQATWDPILAPSSWHGVTTVVMGNCGVGFAPVRPGDEQFLIELMEGVEDIPGAALTEGIEWKWETFSEYLDSLETMPRTVDIGTQVPHGAVRAYIMGQRCNTDQPTDSEIEKMCDIVRDGLEAGALGFSTSRTFLHRDKHGVHVPGTFAESKEMLALGLAMKGFTHGVLEVVSDHFGTDEEWNWVKQVARETGRPITLVPTSAAAYEDGKVFKIAEEASKEGLDIYPQIAGRPTGILHGLTSSFHAFIRHPTFTAELAGLPIEILVERMLDPKMKAKLLSEKPDSNDTMVNALGVLFAQIFPLGERPNYEPGREQSVAGIAEARGVDAWEAMYDLLIGEDGRELFYQPLGFYNNYNLDETRKNLAHPQVLYGLSDGGAHCGVIADAGMPTFILTHWGRDRDGEKLPLEMLVNALSRKTAIAYGMDDRGSLEPGMLADVNVIDFDALRLYRPEAIYDLPTGGRRLVQRAAGYDYVIKTGEVTFENGKHTGVLPGKVVRGRSH
jgi:N-acyl-D-amino-acid deacylase